MKILADFHHSSLFSSYLYTLESRLGHEVYRQIGKKWFKKGYWKINKKKDTIAQYLSTYGYQPSDGTPSLNNVKWVEDDVYYSKDPNTEQIHKAITFDKFMRMDFDCIIASLPIHVKYFKELAQIKKCKLVLQVGNEWDVNSLQDNPDTRIKNLMASVMPRLYKVPHSVYYKQEFDTKIFHPSNSSKPKTVYNFMNVLRNYPTANKLFLELERLMPEYEFKMFGSQNRDGCITGVDNLAAKMREASWIFHVKPGGDGYGYVIHNSYAVGRPRIINKGYYDGKLGGTMISSKNSLIIDNMVPEQIAEMIRNSEERLSDMSKDTIRVFDEHVDFKKDAKKLDKFFKNLL
jgi:hypothetical protein